MAILVIASGAAIHISDHMQVVVIDVDNFDSILVFGRIWDGPADFGRLCEIDRALPVNMMKLSRTDQRIDPRRIDRIGDQLFDNPHITTLGFVE